MRSHLCFCRFSSLKKSQLLVSGMFKGDLWGHHESQSLPSQEEVPLGNPGDVGSKSLNLIVVSSRDPATSTATQSAPYLALGFFTFCFTPKLPPLTTCLFAKFLSSLVRTIFSVRSLFNPFYKEIAQSGLKEILVISTTHNHCLNIF